MFQCRPSLAAASSVPVRSSSFSVQVALVGLPGFFHALHLLALVYLPLFFLLVRHFPSFFRRSSDSVASPFHSATGSPFGPSPFLFSLCTPHSLVFARLSTFLYVFVLLVLFRSFYSLRSIIFTSYHLGGFPSFLRLVLGLRLAFAVHPASLFATSFEGLPFVPSCSLPYCGSSLVFFLLVALLLLPPRSCAAFHRVFLYLLGSLPFPSGFLRLLGFPSVRPRMLFFLASHGYVPAFFWFPSFVTRSNLSSSATGSSLRAESPLSVVRAFFLMGSLLVCFSWCPFSYVPISLLPSSLCVGSPLLRQVFLEVSLPPFFAGWLSRLRLWCFYFLVSAALSPSGFSLLLASPVGGPPINFL